jgi:hypothetical protein
MELLIVKIRTETLLKNYILCYSRLLQISPLIGRRKNSFTCQRRLLNICYDHRRLSAGVFRFKFVALGSLLRVTEQRAVFALYILFNQANSIKLP